MYTSRSLRRSDCATFLLSMFAAGCGDGGSAPTKPDAGTACAPNACDGQPVPAIACADGPTIVVCERNSQGQCQAQVRCGDTDAGHSTPDASTGQTCGGIAGLSCAKSQFCNYEVSAGGNGCGQIADGAGVCQVLPDACPEIYAPVCGCDLRSYSSPCDAHSRGISVLHEGLCTAEECSNGGGRPVYSDGASTPSCTGDEVSFSIPGKEPAICCVPASPTGKLSWYETCGAPVCGNPNQQPSGLPACDTQKAGASCSDEGTECDLGNDCSTHLICAKSDPTQGPGGCPISRAESKVNIRYLDGADLALKHDEIIGLPIAEYTYRNDPAQQPRLGFIIEDVEPSAFVDEARNRVDLYAYTSAIIATVKVQEERIQKLEAELRRLTRQRPKTAR